MTAGIFLTSAGVLLALGAAGLGLWQLRRDYRSQYEELAATQLRVARNHTLLEAMLERTRCDLSIAELADRLERVVGDETIAPRPARRLLAELQKLRRDNLEARPAA